MIIRKWTPAPGCRLGRSEGGEGRSRTSKLRTLIYNAQDGPPAIWRQGSKPLCYRAHDHWSKSDVIGSKLLTRFERVCFFGDRVIPAYRGHTTANPFEYLQVIELEVDVKCRSRSNVPELTRSEYVSRRCPRERIAQRKRLLWLLVL